MKTKSPCVLRYVELRHQRRLRALAPRRPRRGLHAHRPEAVRVGPAVPAALDEDIGGAAQGRLRVGGVVRGVPVENLDLPSRDGAVGHDHHLGGGRVLLDLVEPAGERTWPAAPGALGERHVQVAALPLERRLALADVVDFRGGRAVLAAHWRVVVLAPRVVVLALAVGEDEVQRVRLRGDEHGLGDPPVAALVVEPVLGARRVVVRQRAHANLPRVALPPVVPKVHEQLAAVAQAVGIAPVVHDGESRGAPPPANGTPLKWRTPPPPPASRSTPQPPYVARLFARRGRRGTPRRTPIPSSAPPPLPPSRPRPRRRAPPPGSRSRP